MRKGKLAGAVALFSAMGVVAAAPAGAGVHATAASQAAFCDPLSAADARVFGGRDGRARPRRRRPRARPRPGRTQDLPASRQGQGAASELQGDRPGVLPRRHRRRDRRAHRRADRRPDRGAQQHVRRRRGRRRRPASRSSSPASPARTTPAGSTPNPGGTNEHTMKQTLAPGRRQRAELLLDDRRRLPRLGLPARHRHQARPGLPRRRRRRLGVDAGHLDDVRGPVRPGRDRRRTRSATG